MEILGWICMGITLSSFLFEGKLLRYLNGLGAGGWMIWGILKEEPSVWILNLLIMGIHGWMLIKLSIETRRKNFKFLGTTKIKKSTL